MINFDELDVWRQIPPEEKLEMMARAHSRGILTSLGLILTASTCAVAFQEVGLMWGAILFAPVVFQISASRAWRDLQPRKILRYLAARSAARRYAYSAQSTDLTLDLIFQGSIEELVDEDNAEAVLEAAARGVHETAAWITLFKDTVVVLSEKSGGAASELVQSIDHKLEVESNSLDGKDYSSTKELILTTITPGLEALAEEEIRTRYRLRSTSPGALVVFEKKLLELKKYREIDDMKRQQMIAPAKTSEELDSFDNFQTVISG